MQEPLKVSSWSWWVATAANCWGQENSLVSLLPGSPFQLSEEWDCWWWCWRRVRDTAVTPVWGKKSQTHPPRLPVCPSSLVCLCLTFREKKGCLAWQEGSSQTWSLRRPYGRAHHITDHTAPPQHHGLCQIVPPAADQWLTAQPAWDTQHSQSPWKKRHSHVKYPEVLYHLIVLLITNFSSISSLLNWGCIFRQQTQQYTDILSYPAQAQFKPTIPVSHLCYGNKDTMEEVHCHKRLTGKRPAGPAVPSHLLYSSSLNACSSTQRRPNVWDTWRLRGYHGTWGTMQRQIEEHATGSVLNEKRETLYTGKCAMVCCSPSSNLICTFWIRRIGKSWKH